MNRRLPTTLFFAIVLLAPLPFLYCVFHVVLKAQHLNQLEEQCDGLRRQAMVLKATQNRESALVAALRSKDRQYLDKHIETLTFLLPEIKKLEALAAERPDEEALQRRLHFLTQGSNRLHFVEEAIRSNELFREIEERQQQPVELNEEDLKKVLCLIEGITIWPYGPKEERPQLIVRDFKLSKKELSPQEKTFIVNFDIIKREYLNP